MLNKQTEQMGLLWTRCMCPTQQGKKNEKKEEESGSKEKYNNNNNNNKRVYANNPTSLHYYILSLEKKSMTLISVHAHV